MEKMNLNFSDGENIIKSICWIMSVLSWLLLIVTGWISIRWFDDYKLFATIWTITKKEFKNDADISPSMYYPIHMQAGTIYIVFILTMTIVLVGFIIYIIKSTCKKDEAVFNGMMGQWSKLHFFPLLCISGMFIAGENWDNISDEDYQDGNSENWLDHSKSITISCFVFDIIGLISLIFIYIMTDLNTDWYIILNLKKGTYSCLITLLWYYFCYSIYGLRLLHSWDYNANHRPIKDFKINGWRRGCGIAFSIIFGIGSLIFSFIFKDLVVAGMNALIYAGLTAFYFKFHKDIRKEEVLNKNADGIIDGIMVFFSVSLFVFLIIKRREECLKS